jgi:hypothetical protein
MSVGGKIEEHTKKKKKERRRRRRRMRGKMGCVEKDQDILCVFSI